MASGSNSIDFYYRSYSMNIQEFDFTINLLQSILWQYNKAINLQEILVLKQVWYDQNQTQFWTNWYDNVFNLMTADIFGLSVWSFILNVPLYINLFPEPMDSQIFGFDTNPTSSGYYNFTRGCFSSQGTQLFLTEEEQRLILRLRYYQLVSRGAIPEINKFLNTLFQTSVPPFFGTAWVLDGLDMTMTYVFNFDMPYVMRKVLVELDLLPRPATVGLKYIVLTDHIFGFDTNPASTGYYNFLNGNFAHPFI